MAGSSSRTESPFRGDDGLISVRQSLLWIARANRYVDERSGGFWEEGYHDCWPFTGRSYLKRTLPERNERLTQTIAKTEPAAKRVFFCKDIADGLGAIEAFYFRDSVSSPHVSTR